MTVDAELVDFYKGLVIKQYYDKPNASAEIEMKSERWSELFTLLKNFIPNFDIDTAIGAQLDIIGRVVVLPRGSLPAQYQDDDSYRLLLKGKVAVNNASAYIVREEDTSIQDVADLVFEGGALVVDNQDMTLSVIIDETVDVSLLQALIELDLMPRGLTVSYRDIITTDSNSAFGFSNNPSNKGFSDRFDAGIDGGTFNQRVV